jgi:DNA processing protein
VTEKEAYIALNMINQIGPVTVKTLTSFFGSVQEAFKAGENSILQIPGLKKTAAQALIECRKNVNPKQEIAKAAKAGIKIITLIDSDYPVLLKDIYDAPLVLYIRGEFDTQTRRLFAIVGTRHASHYGREQAERIAFQLAHAGFIIVSGLANGIDAAAHQGALKAQGKTLAVLGSSVDYIYPPQNIKLAKQIISNGALISEYAFGRKPDKTTFPHRNRIISGLSIGTLVIEAGKSSGALITANDAVEQGKSVFAVPGRIDMPLSKGVNGLIKEGAKLVEDIDDILEEFEYLSSYRKQYGTASQDTNELPAGLSQEEKTVIKSLQQGEMDIDTLIRTTGLQAAVLSSLLLQLEMKRIVRMLPGKIVELV